MLVLFRTKASHLLCRRLLRKMSTTDKPRYHYPRLDDIENLENYRPGGFHPVSLGDVFAGGRYRVLHKLGFGGSSTVWLARDQHSRERPQDPGRFVTLKVMSADQSSKPEAEIADIYIPQELDSFSRSVDHPGKECLRTLQDHFIHVGYNGRHLCLVSQFAGPSVASMLECPGRTSGSRRLRGDLARNVAKQITNAVHYLHLAGVVHGDLTSSNILFRVSDTVHQWSDKDTYLMLGNPEMDDVVTRDGSSSEPFAPSQVVAPIDSSRLSSSSLLQEKVVLIDFGQSFFAGRSSSNCGPAIPLHYCSPEALFDSKVSFASDVWALACTIFEIRAGSPPFDPFLSSDALILKQIVETLGKLPDPWWGSWEARKDWFDETGEPRLLEEQLKQGVLLPAIKSPLSQKLREIGLQDDAPEVDEGSMIEKVGTRLEEAEVELLTDLLGKMLRYCPGDRISMTEVVQHPWFAYTQDGERC